MDFETRSEADLRKVGAYKYAQDPSTKVLCLAYRLPGKEVKLWAPALHDFLDPEDLLEYVRKGGVIEAHNAGFEYAVWNYCAVRRYDWPPLHLSQLRCSASKAAALALPRDLESLAKALSLPVEKDMDGRRIMLKMSKPRKPTKNNPALWHDDAEDAAKLYAYCQKDVTVEDAASAAMPDLIAPEQKLWEFSEAMNERGIYADVALCKVARDFCARYERELLEEFSSLTDGEVKTVKQIDRFQEWLLENGVWMDGLTVAEVDDALKREIPAAPRRALEIRRALAKASINKFY
jgi:DNA polymerase